MKKLLVLMLVLGLATAANAALLISVDGVVDPEDSTIVVLPSEHAVIDVWSDGAAPQPNFGAILFTTGPGTISGGVMLYGGSVAGIVNMTGQDLLDYTAYLEEYGYTNITSIIELTFADGSVPPLGMSGKVVDEVDFHCEGLPDATIHLVDVGDPSVVYDTQVIHQPEPATVMLLTLGGLLLRRRR